MQKLFSHIKTTKAPDFPKLRMFVISKKYAIIYYEPYGKSFSVLAKTRLQHYVCNLLRPRYEKQLPQLRSPVPIGKRIVIEIGRLAKGDSFLSLSLQLGFGKSTCLSLCAEFESELCNELCVLSAEL